MDMANTNTDTDTDYDVLVIGGGPAGLSAALYLARYDRTVALFDTGRGRSTWRQVNHNYLGFPGGVPARTLRELGRAQVAAYSQVTMLEHKVDAMECVDGVFTARGQKGAWSGKAVILCTGVVDHYPHFKDWDQYVGRSMFWCITCDGYTCRGVRVVVVGNTDQALLEALQLSRFTDKLTVLTDSHGDAFNPSILKRLERTGIPLVHDRIARVEGEDGYLKVLYTAGGERIELDQLFCEFGATPETKLAQDLGVRLVANGYIAVDSEQRTNVPGAYAAGDVTRLHAQQVATAVHEGGAAASSANYFLYPPELKM